MGLLSSLKDLMKVFTAPAEDPRHAYTTPDQRHQEMLVKVRRAHEKVVAAREQLEARMGEARAREQQLGAEESPDPFAMQLRQVVTEELQALEAEVAQLRQEEQELTLAERQLSARQEALSARQEALSARDSATEARIRIRQELGGLPEELAELGVALDRAEQRTEDVQARASALEHLAELGTLKSGVRLRDPQAQQLANRYASEATLEQTPDLKRQMGLGFKTLLELEYEFRQLQAVVEGRRQTDPLSLTYIPGLAEETYNQGLSVLKDGLELIQAIRSPSREKLEEEIVELEAEVASLKQEGTDLARTRARLREDRAASHRERLDMIQRQQVRAEELMHQCGQCVAALNRTRIELAGIKVEGSRTSVDAATESLRKTIEEAREVQEEMKRLGL